VGVRARALGTGVESRGCFAFLLLPFFSLFIDAKDFEITKKRKYQFWVSLIFMKYLLIQ
jgi:hypothetical protein